MHLQSDPVVQLPLGWRLVIHRIASVPGVEVIPNVIQSRASGIDRVRRLVRAELLQLVVERIGPRKPC